MKKFIAIIIALCFFGGLWGNFAYAATDEFIISDPIRKTYTGREESFEMQNNLKFIDLGGYEWALESVVRNGALDLVKGFWPVFEPLGIVSKQDAIAHVLRALGYEKEVMQQATGIAIQLPDPLTSDEYMSLAYLNYASSLNIISKQAYEDALLEERYLAQQRMIKNGEGDEIAPEDILTMPKDAFRRKEPATREELAYWIYMGLMSVDKSLWENPSTVQSVYSFADWNNININNIMAVESVCSNKIMEGYNGFFLPQEQITRIYLSHVLRNMNNIYYELVGIEKLTGTVANITENTHIDTAVYSYSREIRVRTNGGLVDILLFEGSITTSPNDKTKDALTFKNEQILGLLSLEEGDVIEYLVDSNTDTLLYVQVLGQSLSYTVQGILERIDIDSKNIFIRENDGNLHSYTFIEGMSRLESDIQHFVIDGKRIPMIQLPYGSTIELTLNANIVTEVAYIGEPVIVTESAGIVIENNPDFGFMVILDSAGNLLTKYYYENVLIVEKRNYYDFTEALGHITQLFSYSDFNQRQTTIAQVEPGDLIYFRTHDGEPDIISQISAATNYTVRYGKILKIIPSTNYTQIDIEYENHKIDSLDVPNKILITQNGRVTSIQNMVVGDWVRLLVNEAVIEPGHFMDSVKEINISGPERYISAVISGSLLDIDPIQRKLIVEHTQTLAKTGWTNYKNVDRFDLSGNDIEYYYNGERISLDYAVKYFRQSNATVYIGLENNHTGPKVKIVTFRESRDQVLSPDTVTASNNNNENSFNILSQTESITTDRGTIVLRNGRLVTGSDIHQADYARVVLNGPNQAAVVDIGTTPDISQLLFARGKILQVTDSVKFSVKSVSILSGHEWIFTPVEKEFDIDYNTIFLDENGYVEPDTFISYTENTVADSYVTIVGEGTRASFVVFSQFAANSVTGTVYSVEDGVVGIKDAKYLDSSSGIWKNISSTNATLLISIYPNSLIAKYNEIVTINHLEIGDVLQIMTNSLPDPIPGGTEIDGDIILVIN